MPKPPIDPDSFDKVNFVIDAWTTGCDAPWYIYIETLKPALLTAFITLLTFGFDDVLRGFFRPKGLYRRRTGKRKGKWLRRIPRFPEIGELLGSHISGATEVKGKRWSTPTRTLWRIDGVFQQIFFWWLVVSVVEDFIFDWTSLLMESRWCLDDAVGRFSYQAVGWFGLPGHVWRTAGFGTEDYEHAPPTWSLISGRTGSVNCMVTAALAVEPAPGHPNPTSFRVIVESVPPGTIFADSETNDQLVNGAGFGVAMGSVPTGVEFRVRALVEGTDLARYGNGVVMAFEVPE